MIFLFKQLIFMWTMSIFEGVAPQGHSQLPSLPQAAVSAFELPAVVPNQDGEPSKGHIHSCCMRLAPSQELYKKGLKNLSYTPMYKAIYRSPITPFYTP